MPGGLTLYGSTDEYSTKQKRMQFRGEDILPRSESDHLYAVPIWYKATNSGPARRKLRAAQELALVRATKTYRMTSTDALCGLTEMPSIYLVVKERARLLERMAKNKTTAYRTRERTANENKAEMSKEERLQTIRELQAE